MATSFPLRSANQLPDICLKVHKLGSLRKSLDPNNQPNNVLINYLLNSFLFATLLNARTDSYLSISAKRATIKQNYLEQPKQHKSN